MTLPLYFIKFSFIPKWSPIKLSSVSIVKISCKLIKIILKMAISNPVKRNKLLLEWKLHGLMGQEAGIKWYNYH
jgi:hypothetical protein